MNIKARFFTVVIHTEGRLYIIRKKTNNIKMAAYEVVVSEDSSILECYAFTNRHGVRAQKT